jgi:hypothetical protein
LAELSEIPPVARATSLNALKMSSDRSVIVSSSIITPPAIDSPAAERL